MRIKMLHFGENLKNEIEKILKFNKNLQNIFNNTTIYAIIVNGNI